MIWQVTPLSRPHFASRVVEQFRAQTYEDKRLCVVLNGPARDVEVKADLVLRTPPGRHAALNAAFAELRGEAGSVVVRDDDDIFTPGGLAEFAELFESHSIVGQKRHWVWDGEHTWLLNSGCWGHYGDHLIWSGNLGLRGDALDAIGELHYSPAYEDVQNALRVLLLEGCKIWHKGPDHACFDRTQNDHAWTASMITVRQRSRGPALRICGYRPDLIAGKGEAEFDVVEKPTVKDAMRSEWAA